MVVDLVVPEKGLRKPTLTCFFLNVSHTNLVTISPEEVLRPQVLVGVFNSLLQSRKMLPVLPMFVPQVVGIDASEDQAGNNDTGKEVRDEIVTHFDRRGTVLN